MVSAAGTRDESSSDDSWTDSASDADGDADLEEADLEEVHNTVLLNLVMPNLKPTRVNLSSDMRTWKHRQSGIQHIQFEDGPKFLCGRKVTERYFLCKSEPAVDDPVCQVCLGSGKAKQA